MPACDEAYFNPLYSILDSMPIKREDIKTLARQLGQYTDMICGDSAHVMQLVSTFESLPIVKDTEWYKSPTSACELFTVCYPHVSQAIKAALLNNFRRLCQNAKSTIRCVAAINLGEFANVVELEFLKFDLVDMFIQLAEDDEEWVRSFAVKSAGHIAQRMSQEDVRLLMTPAYFQLAKDKSSRVRRAVAEEFIVFQKALGLTDSMDVVIAYRRLILDPDTAVSSIAKSQVMKFVCNFEHEFGFEFFFKRGAPEEII